MEPHTTRCSRRIPWRGLVGCLITLLAAAALLRLRTSGAREQFHATADRLDDAIIGALNFLSHAQLPSGAFPGLYCQTRSLTSCVEDVTPFVSSFVLHALSFLPPAQTRRLREPAMEFLLASQHSPGVWSYWPTRSPRHTWTPPDLDDTACARAALRLNGHRPDAGLDTILEARMPEGSFWTWVGLAPSENEVDCAVNANVLFDLALEGQPTSELVAYVDRVMGSQEFERCSHYYLQPEALFYFISRAARDGKVAELTPALAHACEILQTRQQPDGGFGDAATTACAALTWLNAGHSGDHVRRALAWLLAHQRRDGGWSTQAVYARVVGGPLTWSFFGSEAMVSALGLEALIKARNQLIQ